MTDSSRSGPVLKLRDRVPAETAKQSEQTQTPATTNSRQKNNDLDRTAGRRTQNDETSRRAAGTETDGRQTTTSSGVRVYTRTTAARRQTRPAGNLRAPVRIPLQIESLQTNDPDHTIARLHGRLATVDDESPAAAFDYARQRIIDWLAQQWPEPLPEAARVGAGADLAAQHFSLKILSTLGMWAARFDCPDPHVEEDLWSNEFILTVDQTAAFLHFRASFHAASGQDEPVEYALPECLRSLLTNPGLYDGHMRIQEAPLPARNVPELKKLHALLTDPLRTLPLVVISASVDPREPGASRYVINPNVTARDCAGIAFVAAIPVELSHEWAALAGQAAPTLRGSVRIYRPGYQREAPDASASEFHPAEKIRVWHHHNLTGPSAYARFLRQHLLEIGADDIQPAALASAPKKTQPTAATADPAEMTALREQIAAYERRAAMDREKIAEYERRLAVSDTNELFQDLMKANARVKELEARHLEDARTVNEYDRKLADSEDRVAELEEDAERFLTDVVRLEGERNRLVQQLVELGQTPRLAEPAAEESAASGETEGEIPLPKTLKPLAAWAEKHLAGRLAVHQRALRAAKDANFQDVPLIYKGLLLLANEYRNMRLQEGEGDLKEQFESKLRALGFTLQRSLNPEVNGQRLNEYNIPWGEKRQGAVPTHFMEWHLRKGFSRDTRFMCCIYFFWDEETRQVVVGSLPAHLDTRHS